MATPFRIGRTPPHIAGLQDAPPADPFKEYMDRLARLIPSEALLAYVTGYGIAPQHGWWWAPVCLVLVLVIRTWGTSDRSHRPQFVAIGISAVSFVLWVLSMEGNFFHQGFEHDMRIPALLTIAWTAVLPVVYRGDK